MEDKKLDKMQSDSVTDTVYGEPDINILAKYGFEITEIQGIYRAEFTHPYTGLLYFQNGMIRLTVEYEDHPEYNDMMLRNILIDNDQELDVILRQALYLPIFKAGSRAA